MLKLKLLGLAVLLALGLALPAHADTTVATVYPSPIAGWVNGHRYWVHGEWRLKRNTALESIECRHARWMARYETLKHWDLTQTQYVKDHGFSALGENIGWATNWGHGGAWWLYQFYLHSPEHHANIHSRWYTQQGDCIAVDSHGRLWHAQAFWRP